MPEATYVTATAITHDNTAISSHLHDTPDGKIPAVYILDYQVSINIHVTRQSLRNLIDACLALQARLAEREVTG